MSIADLRNNGRVAWAAFVMTLRMNAPDPFTLFTIVVQPLIVACWPCGCWSSAAPATPSLSWSAAG